MVLVKHILEAAAGRLAVLSWQAPLCDAAGILANQDTPLVVVCDDRGVALGVISRGDVVKVLASARIDAFGMNAAAIMTSPMFACQVTDPLQGIWSALNSRALRCAPVLDVDGRPQGVVHARDVATALLDEVTQEEVLLRDYVLGVGYQ